MDESGMTGGNPAWLLLAELARAAFRQGNFQPAYFLDTSRAEICGELRREDDDLGGFIREMLSQTEPPALAAETFHAGPASG